MKLEKPNIKKSWSQPNLSDSASSTPQSTPLVSGDGTEEYSCKLRFLPGDKTRGVFKLELPESETIRVSPAALNAQVPEFPQEIKASADLNLPVCLPDAVDEPSDSDESQTTGDVQSQTTAPEQVVVAPKAERVHPGAPIGPIKVTREARPPGQQTTQQQTTQQQTTQQQTTQQQTTLQQTTLQQAPGNAIVPLLTPTLTLQVLAPERPGQVALSPQNAELLRAAVRDPEVRQLVAQHPDVQQHRHHLRGTVGHVGAGILDAFGIEQNPTNLLTRVITAIPRHMAQQVTPVRTDAQILKSLRPHYCHTAKSWKIRRSMGKENSVTVKPELHSMLRLYDLPGVVVTQTGGWLRPNIEIPDPEIRFSDNCALNYGSQYLAFIPSTYLLYLSPARWSTCRATGAPPGTGDVDMIYLPELTGQMVDALERDGHLHRVAEFMTVLDGMNPPYELYGPPFDPNLSTTAGTGVRQLARSLTSYISAAHGLSALCIWAVQQRAEGNYQRAAKLLLASPEKSTDQICKSALRGFFDENMITALLFEFTSTATAGTEEAGAWQATAKCVARWLNDQYTQALPSRESQGGHIVAAASRDLVSRIAQNPAMHTQQNPIISLMIIKAAVRAAACIYSKRREEFAKTRADHIKDAVDKLTGLPFVAILPAVFIPIQMTAYVAGSAVKAGVVDPALPVPKWLDDTISDFEREDTEIGRNMSQQDYNEYRAALSRLMERFGVSMALKTAPDVKFS